MNKKESHTEEEYRLLEARLKSAHEEIERLTSMEEKSTLPNLRISLDGKLVHANPAANRILLEWNCNVQQRIPQDVIQLLNLSPTSTAYSSYIKIPFRYFSVGFVVAPARELGWINLYGSELEYKEPSQLDDAAKLYRLLIENSNAVLIRWKCEDGFPVVFLSENVAQFGYNYREFIEKKLNYTDIIHPLDKARVLQEYQKHRDVGDPSYHQEYRIITKQGDTRWIDDLTSVDDSNPEFHHAVLLDITDRKNSEALLETSMDELKKINTELDRFVYCASHDLKAPLRSIMGLINLARTDVSADSDQAEYLDKIFKSATKLDSFICDLINFSRNTRLDLQIKQMNFQSIIEETVEHLKYMEHADLIVINSQANDVPFYSDENRISIIFGNMISNAIKYQDLTEGKEAELAITININENEAVLEFMDNGIGIAEEQQHNIFNMFTRASEQSEGSGLGLFIVKEIVHKLEGSLSVSSEPGKGSIFTFTIPNHKI